MQLLVSSAFQGQTQSSQSGQAHQRASNPDIPGRTLSSQVTHQHGQTSQSAHEPMTAESFWGQIPGLLGEGSPEVGQLQQVIKLPDATTIGAMFVDLHENFIGRLFADMERLCQLGSGRNLLLAVLGIATAQNIRLNFLPNLESAANPPRMDGSVLTIPIALNYSPTSHATHPTIETLPSDPMNPHAAIDLTSGEIMQYSSPTFITVGHELEHALEMMEAIGLIREIAGEQINPGTPEFVAAVERLYSVAGKRTCFDPDGDTSLQLFRLCAAQKLFQLSEIDTLQQGSCSSLTQLWKCLWNSAQEMESIAILGSPSHSQFSENAVLSEAISSGVFGKCSDSKLTANHRRIGHGSYAEVNVVLKSESRENIGFIIKIMNKCFAFAGKPLPPPPTQVVVGGTAFDIGDVPRDGNCLFTAIGRQFNPAIPQEQIRAFVSRANEMVRRMETVPGGVTTAIQGEMTIGAAAPDRAPTIRSALGTHNRTVTARDQGWGGLVDVALAAIDFQVPVVVFRQNPMTGQGDIAVAYGLDGELLQGANVQEAITNPESLLLLHDGLAHWKIMNRVPPPAHY